MGAYTIRRLLLSIPTLFVATLIVFLTVRLIPGDIIDIMVTEHSHISEMDRARLKAALGLDVPIYVQYGRWIRNIVVHGDLGKSLWKDTPVTDDLLPRLPVTLELGFMAMIVALIIALPIGIYSAIRQDTVGDYIARSFAIAGIAIPSFWLATLVIVFPSVWWGWSPPIMRIRFIEDPVGNLKMFIIPAVILGMALSGVTMRMMRTMMLEVLRQDYIRTAWSKGLRERVVVIRHALKNAFIPVITLIGLQLPILIGGSVIIEQIFNLPGVGLLLLESVFNRDYPLVTAIMLIIAALVLLINLAVDLTYGYLDPRVKYQ